MPTPLEQLDAFCRKHHGLSAEEYYGEDRLEILLEQASPLPEAYPEDFRRYLDLFHRYLPKRPYHARTCYGGGFLAVKGHYKSTKQPYDAYCHAQVIAKHLDYDRWVALNPDKRHTDYFWVAMNAGKYSSLVALDVDNKENVLGSYRSRNGEKTRPVVALTLDHLKKIKIIYDAFPGHIWCVSSGTLGLHVWEKLTCPCPIGQIQNRNKAKLKGIGLGSTEVHPMFGRPFRRPFGQDYHTITDDGLLTNWRQQLHFFDNPHTPTFASIWSALRKLVEDGWADYQAGSAKSVFPKDRQHLMPFFRSGMLDCDALNDELNIIDSWVQDGCPDTSPVSIAVPAAITKSNVVHRIDCGLSLSDVCKAGWLDHIIEWAINGLPCHDSLYLVVSQMARWLFFVEFADLPEEDRFDKVADLLNRYAMTKGNGFVSRLADGRDGQVINHIRRIVRTAISKTDERGRGHFANVRARQAAGRYRSVIRLEPLIEAQGEEESVSSCVGFVCSSISSGAVADESRPIPASTASERRQKAKGWDFLPDDTPLPEPMQQAVQEALGRVQGRTWKKIVRIINLLKNYGGRANLGQQSLKKIGFSDHRSRTVLWRLSPELIVAGGYCPAAGVGREYRLTEKAKKMMGMG